MSKKILCDYCHEKVALKTNSYGKWICRKCMGGKPEPIRVTHQRVGRNDPCSCGSDRKFKKCCGAKSKDQVRHVHRLQATQNEPVRFFVSEPPPPGFDDLIPVMDVEGDILVFADRPTSMQFIDANFPNESYMSIGMGDAKWAMFQEDCTYVEVKDLDHANELLRDRNEAMESLELCRVDWDATQDPDLN